MVIGTKRVTRKETCLIWGAGPPFEAETQMSRILVWTPDLYKYRSGQKQSHFVPKRYITLKEGWLSVGSFKVVFEEGRRLDSEYEALIASGYLKFARGGTEQISKIYLFIL